MGLYDAMNASVTGMQAQSNYLTNIGQNISNSSTVGYKEADTEFSTLVDQAAVGQTAAGGVISNTQLNIAQQGTLESTPSSTDLAISGNGFFVVSNAAGQEFLTRAGSFVPDKNGNLVNAAGYYLMGYSLANGTPTMASNSLSGMQVVNVDSSTLSASPTTSGTLTANLPATNSVIAAADLPSANRSTSTYDEKTSMVMYNDLGGAENVDLYLRPDQFGNLGGSAFDHSTASASGGFPYSSAAAGDHDRELQSEQRRFSSTSANSLSIPVPGGAAMTLNLSAMTQLAGNLRRFDLAGERQRRLVGRLGDHLFQRQHVLQLTNGANVSAYKIPLADVPSPDNLSPPPAMSIRRTSCPARPRSARRERASSGRSSRASSSNRPSIWRPN